MPKVLLVGAGQFGSRHLQGIAKFAKPLNVYVVDPSSESLRVAKERFDSVDPISKHKVEYLTEIPKLDTIDVAIIATSSNVREEAIDSVLRQNKVRYFILEKILFHKMDSYRRTIERFEREKIKAWVNCSMRMMPLYKKMKDHFYKDIVIYNVTGSQYGFVSNAIHYLDHLSYLCGSLDMRVETFGLINETIPSKRKGFFELNGTINAFFKNGSVANLTCFPQGTSPMLIEALSDKYRYLSKESEGKALFSSFDKQWKWEEIDAPVIYQSQMTGELIESLLVKGTANLPTYDESMRIHLPLMDALERFLKKQGINTKDGIFFT